MKEHTEVVLKVLEHVQEHVHKAIVAEANRRQKLTEAAAEADEPPPLPTSEPAEPIELVEATSPGGTSAFPSDTAPSDGIVHASDETLSDEEQQRIIDTLIDHSQDKTHELFIDVSKGEIFDDVAIRMIAYADSMLHGSESDEQQASQSSAAVQKSRKLISPVLLAMQQYFERYEGRMYW